MTGLIRIGLEMKLLLANEAHHAIRLRHRLMGASKRSWYQCNLFVVMASSTFHEPLAGSAKMILRVINNIYPNN